MNSDCYRTLCLLFSGPLAILLFGLLCLLGNSCWLAGIVATGLYVAFLCKELRRIA